jgi:NADH-quinone oxidoreductase subunit F
VTARLSSAAAYYRRREAAQAALDPDRLTVTVCGGTGCSAFGSAPVRLAFEEEIRRRGLAGRVSVLTTGCHGFCQQGPVVVILPSKIFYPKVSVEDVPGIVEQTLLRGEVIDELCYIDPASGRAMAREGELPFYAKQTRRVFRLNGLIDPVDLDGYIARDGYLAAVKALEQMTPEQVVEEVKTAGLRGRGGAGFPTGLKWEYCRRAQGERKAGAGKVLICNADEGDPGAFMDRSVLEGTPHAVLEGMIIAAYAIGADAAIIYVRAEYPLAVKNARLALEQARDAGLLGENILGRGFDLEISIHEGAGAFVCGEETALIASLEGGRGQPRPRPPFPAQSGFRERPTTINNVETLANVPLIVLEGSEKYRSLGTETSKGTKIFALAGKVNNTGLVEVPMGSTLRQIVFDIGGGILKNRRFKAVQMGGPSGGCVPAAYLDLPLDYESVKKIGAIMGSGGLIVMDETTCVVDIARYFLEFVQAESCGKCVPCRVGTRRMLEILTRICAGEGEEGDLEDLERLARTVGSASLCGLGQTAPNPVLSTLRYFRHEYEEHIRFRHCRASVCEALVGSPCGHACPADVDVPRYVGLIAENRLAEAAGLIRRRNPFLAVCGRVCDAPCERRCRRADLDEPLAIRALKRYVGDNTAPPPAATVGGAAEVGILGSGPAGLSCAYFLALMGRRSVVYEALPVPGGMLAVGIPEYRLPKDALSRDIDFILSHGIELRTGSPVASLGELAEDGFKALVVATGAHRGRELGVEGGTLGGVMDALKFLRGRALGLDTDCGRRVVVIGGGNAAVDAARSALRLGAEEVRLVYRRSRAEMPAYEEEIEGALEEGVELLELAAPRRISGAGGRVRRLELVRMRLGAADPSGRRRPEEIAGSEFGLDCDTVIAAIGQLSSTEVAGEEAARTAAGGLSADARTGATPREGVFAIGDCVSGGATVVEAIGAGQRAAAAIDRMLGGSGMLPAGESFRGRRPSEEDLEKIIPRSREPVLAAGRRRRSFAEVLGCLPAAEAGCEAGRCLRCDLERAEQGGGKKSGVV